MSSPVLGAALQAAIMSAVSNSLVQCLAVYKADSWAAIDVTTFLRFVVFSFLATPPNYAWQRLLEDWFPSRPKSKGRAPEKGGSTKDTPDVMQERGRLSLTNTGFKFVLDQTLGAAGNTILFIAGMGMLKAKAWPEIASDIHADFLPLIAAGYKLWPMVSLLNLAVVPFEHRMTVCNSASFVWGVYMSFRAI